MYLNEICNILTCNDTSLFTITSHVFRFSNFYINSLRENFPSHHYIGRSVISVHYQMNNYQIHFMFSLPDITQNHPIRLECRLKNGSKFISDMLLISNLNVLSTWGMLAVGFVILDTNLALLCDRCHSMNEWSLVCSPWVSTAASFQMLYISAALFLDGFNPLWMYPSMQMVYLGTVRIAQYIEKCLRLEGFLVHCLSLKDGAANFW